MRRLVDYTANFEKVKSSILLCRMVMSLAALNKKDKFKKKKKKTEALWFLEKQPPWSYGPNE